MNLQRLPLHDEILNLDAYLRTLRRYEIQNIHEILYPAQKGLETKTKNELILSILEHLFFQFSKSEIKKKKQQWEASRAGWPSPQHQSPVETIRTPLQKKKQSQIGKKHQSTTRFLTFMKNNMGNLNSYMKCAYNIGNVCGKRKFSTAIQNKTCSLASQCFVTSQTINYMFSKENAPIIPFLPTMEFINNWKDHLLPGMVGNINITVGSTREGFPGHICNVVVIKELKGRVHGYLIQSYIQKYTIDWVSLSWEEIQNVLLDYAKIFWDSTGRVFTQDDQRIWKDLTKVDRLEAFDGSALIGTPKPTSNSCSMTYTVMYEYNLGDYLKERYHSLLRRCLQNIETDRCSIENAFGPYMERQQLQALLEKEMKRTSI